MNMSTETAVRWRRAFARGRYSRLLTVGAMVCAGGGSAAFGQVRETILHSASETEGNNFSAALLVDDTGPAGTARRLYGVGNMGGTNSCGCGTVFRLTAPKSGRTAWTDKTLWDFSGGTDGGFPYPAGAAGLVAETKRITANTAMFGTTDGGGNGGYGTVFSQTGRTLTTIWAFTGGADGGAPGNVVAADESGTIYTPTNLGGGSSGCGTIVQLTPPAQGQTAWTETTIWSFSGNQDGCNPIGLIADASGALYGTTEYGGSDANNGTVIKLVPPEAGQTTWSEQTLYAFPDGSFTTAPPAFGKGGALFVPSLIGGPTNSGTLIKLTPPKDGNAAWKARIVWNFNYNVDGTYVEAPVIVDKTGAVYGVAFAGGANNAGTAFKLTPPTTEGAGWTETILWTFAGGNDDGAFPSAVLAPDKAGMLYGTTQGGGGSGCFDELGCGTAFSLAGTGYVP